MTSSSVVLRQTAVGCALLAGACAVTLSVAGHPIVGLALGAGLLAGSLNGYLIDGMLSRGAPFVAASLARIVFFSLLVLMAAFILRRDAWAVALGIGVAQLVMMGVSVRRGLKR